MARTRSHRLSASLVSLGRTLTLAERGRLTRWLRRAVSWQATLRGFPSLVDAPDATPYVSLYAGGTLRGCFGSHEGSPGERLGRAFVLATTDARWGGIRSEERSGVEASAAYVTRAVPVRADEAIAVVEPGRHGVAVVEGERATLVLPSVARDRGIDGPMLLDVLARKASKESLEGVVWIVEADEVSTRGTSSNDSRRAARVWLASLVKASGEVAFEMDPLSGAPRPEGVMRHGRIAVTVQALAHLGAPEAHRAKRWLAREIERALAGRQILGWPDRKDMVLGTLALAARAGIDVPLAEIARAVDAGATAPWHAAQVASVLGNQTPRALWSSCVKSLDQRPFAPYVAMAARLRGDSAILERCANALVASIRDRAPFEGGADVTPIPETALTAAAAEAIAPLRAADARSALERARGFLERQQILDVPAAMHPRTLGAFRASPIAPLLRCDVTAHAVLAVHGRWR